ncbi:hypothetical protein FBU30_010701 [Linnemannia zychae]|nr:hypothetical protein FBU30_010701 [Linnemannia zychae]
MTSKINNAVKETMGSAKEKIGRATNNERMMDRGAAQKAEAQINKQEHAGAHAQGMGHNLDTTAHRPIGAVENDPTLPANRVYATDNTLQGQAYNSNLQGRGNVNDPTLQGRGNINDPTLQGRGNINDPTLQGRGHINNPLGNTQRNY